MQNAPLERWLCNLHPTSFCKTILRAFLSTTTPFCSPLSVTNQARSALGIGTKETEMVELAESGIPCLNHILHFLWMYLPHCHLSSCPMRGTSCGTLSRNSTLQRLLWSSTTQFVDSTWALECWLAYDTGRRASNLARVRTAVQDSTFQVICLTPSSYYLPL